jgi:hypothetical protein
VRYSPRVYVVEGEEEGEEEKEEKRKEEEGGDDEKKRSRKRWSEMREREVSCTRMDLREEQ